MGAAQSRDGDERMEPCTFKSCPPVAADARAVLDGFDMPDWRGLGAARFSNFSTEYKRSSAQSWKSLYKSIKNECDCIGGSDFERARRLEELMALKAEMCLNRQMLARRNPQTFDPGEQFCGSKIDAYPFPQPLPPPEWETIRRHGSSAFDACVIGNGAVEQRNILIETHNNLVQRFNFAAKECDKYVCMMAANGEMLRKRKGCSARSLANAPVSERHIGDALQMQVNEVQQCQWEVAQVEEALCALEFSKPRTKARATKLAELLAHTKEMIPSVGVSTRKCVAEKKNMLNEFQDNMGKLEAALRECITPTIKVWNSAKFPIRAAIVTFLNMVEEGHKTGNVEDVVRKAAMASDLEYALHRDWLKKLSEDRGPVTALFDIQQAFLYLESIPDLIRDYRTSYMAQMSMQEALQPWIQADFGLGSVEETLEKDMKMKCSF